ncbi:DUF397 domain-containing protein [Nocardiopsis mangrovi]|uniref:DUF397 domain-containing protein n=1 Tax=Nocardiopsis mangrovi TaxID=1179818 RepID=A0ABV9E2D8_9ACTN
MAHEWHTSSYSGSSADCVEVTEGSTVLLRDSRNRGLAALEFSATEWRALLSDIDVL